MTQAVQNIELQKIDGSAATLNDYAGKVLLVVNVASKCGLTPQYESLEKFYRSHQAQGLEVLAFPANNFKGQEPGSNEEIASFCSTTYDVTFPLFAKISVVGEDQHPLYQALTAAQPDALGEGPFRERLSSKGIEIAPQPQVLWNFEKFLVNRKGEVVGRFSPDVTAEDARLVAAVEAELAKA